ncbi:MAG: VacJ family lipoprotein [Pseudomonadota bacterium]|nr:VacJ family lipoprotein [Pseudomonadota bacterium]
MYPLTAAKPPLPATRASQRRLLLAVVGGVLLSGCATTHGPANPKDPLQGINRGIYKFNDVVDRAVLKPVAQGYRFVVPQFARIGVHNFFSNLNDVTVTVNDVLQGKVRQGGHDALRFALNTTIGLLGFVDVATRAGFEKHNEDFGQTLGVWGAGPGPYLVLPFLGPSSVRDTFGIIGDLPTSPYTRFQHVSVAHRDEAYGLSAVSTREGLLDTGDMLEDATLSGDTYNFVRDAWLQRRQNLVYDGNPPPDPDESLDDDPAAAPAAPAAPAKPGGAPALPPAAPAAAR